MNLPAIQRIAMEFERENDMMEQRQEMMDDAIDDTFEDEEEESEEIVNQVLDEIGIDLSQSVLIQESLILIHSSEKLLKVSSTNSLGV
jgi:charged multivesicular body protein 2A